jgi:hypothetical protein
MIYTLTNIIMGFQFRIVVLPDKGFDADAITEELTRVIENYIF